MNLINVNRVGPLMVEDLPDFALVLSGYLERGGTVHTHTDPNVTVFTSHWGTFPILTSEWCRVGEVLILNGLPTARGNTYGRVLQVLESLFTSSYPTER